MKHSAFFWFVLPSAIAMLLFIFFPIVSVVIQSLHTAHEQVIIEVENCGPFGAPRPLPLTKRPPPLCAKNNHLDSSQAWKSTKTATTLPPRKSTHCGNKVPASAISSAS